MRVLVFIQPDGTMFPICRAAKTTYVLSDESYGERLRSGIKETNSCMAKGITDRIAPERNVHSSEKMSCKLGNQHAPHRYDVMRHASF